MDPSEPRPRTLLPSGAANLSLRARLLALLCAAALLPMGVIGALEGRATSGSLSTERAAKFREIAYEISSGIDRTLSERYGDTLAFASGDDASSMDAGRVTAWMRTVMPLYAPNYRLLAVADRSGRLVAAQAADATGRPVPAPAGLTGANVADQAWFRGAAGGDLADGTAFVDGPAADPPAGPGGRRPGPHGRLQRPGQGRSGPGRGRLDQPVRLRRGRGHDRGAPAAPARQRALRGRDHPGQLRRRGAARQRRPARGRDPARRPGRPAGAQPRRERDRQTRALDGGEGTVLVGWYHSTAQGRLAGLGWAVLATEDAREATRPAAAVVRRTVLLGLVIAAVMVALAFFIPGAVMRRLREYSAFAGRVAGGDLTARVSTGGAPELRELSGHLNDMAANLRHLSTEVRGGAQGVGTAATEILATVSEQGSSLTEQSAAISQTSATAEELRAAAEHTAGRAREVAERAQAASKASEEGTEVVEGIVGGTEEIRERVEAIAKDILALSEQTQQIGEITATVDDLAEQSNLLALNATIEAARAGEQGRGFAVVAAEVRNLAELSRQGTGQVRAILSDIQRATNEAVLATEQGIKVVERGRGRAQRAGEVIGQLGDTVRDTAQAAQQIAASAHEQQVAVDQIAVAMREINQATSQFVTGASDSRSAAEGLNGLARELQLVTERYRVEVG